MPNTFAFDDHWISMEPLRQLLNKLQCAQFGNTDDNDQYTKPFPVGSTIQKKLPQRWLITSGLGWSPQNIDRKTTSITVDRIRNVHFEHDSLEAALSMERSREEFKKQYMEPATSQLAQQIDLEFAAFAAQNCNNIVGVLGTNPATLDAVSGAARQRLVELACPASNDKGMIVTPAVERAMVQAGSAVFNDADAISKQYKEGSMGRQGGFNWYSSMSLYRHTAGVWAGAVTLTAGPADGATTLTITAGAGDTFNTGDVIALALSNEVNPGTRQDNGRLMTYTITSDLVAAGGGADVITIRPAIYGPGSPYQNVTALPLAGAALTLFPGTVAPGGVTGSNGLAIHRDAFALVGVPMEVPKAVEIASISRDPQTGLAMRFVRAWDQEHSTMKNRWDVLFGFGCLYPANCCVRILGA